MSPEQLFLGGYLTKIRETCLGFCQFRGVYLDPERDRYYEVLWYRDQDEVGILDIDDLRVEHNFSPRSPR